MLLVKLRQTQQQIRACETAMVFAFVEVRSGRSRQSGPRSDEGGLSVSLCAGPLRGR